MTNKAVLILNKHWVPITTTSMFRAITLLCRDRACVLDTETFERFDLHQWIGKFADNESFKENAIKLPSGFIVKPEIVILNDYDAIPYLDISLNKKNIYKRDKYKCQYCIKKLCIDELSIDHVVPKSRGGGTSWENCVTSCKRCNNKKSNRPLSKTSFKLYKKPEKPRWSPIVSFLPSQYPKSWEMFIGKK